MRQRIVLFLVAGLIAGCPGRGMDDSGDVAADAVADAARDGSTDVGMDTRADTVIAPDVQPDQTVGPDVITPEDVQPDAPPVEDVQSDSGSSDVPIVTDVPVVTDVPIVTDVPGTTCGNATREGAEVCDGTDVGTATCVTRGFRAGTLRCAASCLAFDETGCTNVVVNEVHSTPAPDTIEFFNTGTTPADISGYTVTDSDPTHIYTFPAGTIIPAMGYRQLVETTDLTFGLGQPDEVNFYEPGGTRIDHVAWTTHAVNALARCPNGSGPLVVVATTTYGASNMPACPVCGNATREGTEVCDGADLAAATCVTRGFLAGTLRCNASCMAFDESGCTNVVVNEVHSSPAPDTIEFFNTGTTPADISGYTVTDSDPTHIYTFPAGTIIPAMGYRQLVETTDLTFGLGQPDEVNFYEPGGTRIDHVAWTTHAVNALARCPNGSGPLVVVATTTYGATNMPACPP